MEYCQYGDLHHFLLEEPLLPKADAQRLTYQILQGLDHMHENGIAHMDLRPAVSTVYIFTTV